MTGTSDANQERIGESRMRLGTFARNAALAALALALAGPGHAQATFPAQPIRIVNAFTPGGPSDIISRAMAEKMAQALKQPVMVENKAGAGGNIAADLVAKAPADGYTILSGIDSTFTVNPSIYKQIPFRPQDLKPLLVMASSGLLVGVNPSVGVKTLAELVAKAKTSPMLFSSGSNGSPGHLAASILVDATGAKITHVPYKGNSQAVVAVLQKAMLDALAHSDVRAQLANLDLFYEGQTGAAAQTRLTAQGERFARIIKATGMKIE
jgi:tripartite-type tricarboxylate transporter receptor subunit TctC